MHLSFHGCMHVIGALIHLPQLHVYICPFSISFNYNTLHIYNYVYACIFKYVLNIDFVYNLSCSSL